MGSWHGGEGRDFGFKLGPDGQGTSFLPSLVGSSGNRAATTLQGDCEDGGALVGPVPAPPAGREAGFAPLSGPLAACG